MARAHNDEGDTKKELFEMKEQAAPVGSVSYACGASPDSGVCKEQVAPVPQEEQLTSEVQGAAGVEQLAPSGLEQVAPSSNALTATQVVMDSALDSSPTLGKKKKKKQKKKASNEVTSKDDGEDHVKCATKGQFAPKGGTSAKGQVAPESAAAGGSSKELVAPERQARPGSSPNLAAPVVGTKKEQSAPKGKEQVAPDVRELSAADVTKLTDTASQMPDERLEGLMRLLEDGSMWKNHQELVVIFRLEFERRKTCTSCRDATEVFALDSDDAAASSHATYPPLVAAVGMVAKKQRMPG